MKIKLWCELMTNIHTQGFITAKKSHHNYKGTRKARGMYYITTAEIAFKDIKVSLRKYKGKNYPLTGVLHLRTIVRFIPYLPYFREFLQ